MGMLPLWPAQATRKWRMILRMYLYLLLQKKQNLPKRRKKNPKNLAKKKKKNPENANARKNTAQMKRTMMVIEQKKLIKIFFLILLKKSKFWSFSVEEKFYVELIHVFYLV